MSDFVGFPRSRLVVFKLLSFKLLIRATKLKYFEIFNDLKENS